jgi:hypothetical protein
MARLAAALLAVLALAAPASAASGSASKLRAPSNFRAFLLRASEQPGHSFPRTPAFAWGPVAGAKKYELVLSISPLFRGNGIVWDDPSLSTPVGTVPLALPWITGNPHSLYARVRAIAANGAVGPWTASYGFDIRSDAVPAPLPAPPGLVRWTPIEGATSYQVWFQNLNLNGASRNHYFETATNVADEREYYTFHQTHAFIGRVEWRVRAVRQRYGAPTNALPVVSYGPWSPEYVSFNPSFAHGPLDETTFATTSDATASPHQLMAGFSWSGDSGINGPEELYRVSVYTDKDCLNRVFESPAVGSPAYAPRVSATGLDYPSNTDEVAVARLQNLVPGPDPGRRADDTPATPTELGSGATFTPIVIGAAAAGTSASSGSSGSAGAASSSTGAAFPSSITSGAPAVDLWDINWPEGQYYWTVIPVRWQVATPPVTTLIPPPAPVTPPTGPPPSPPIEYWDDELAEDVCMQGDGRVATLGKMSAQPLTTDGLPFSSGLSPKGGLRAANIKTPSFYGAPLVAWKPVLGASFYEVQWSKTAYPWRPPGNLFTYATQTTLPLQPGKWYYRIRGIDLYVPTGAAQLAWSEKTPIVIAKPKFRVVKGK